MLEAFVDVPARGAAPGPRRAPLRVGLFVDTPRQPRWLVAACSKIAASECAEIVVVAAGCAPPARDPWMWRWYSRIDRKLFGTGPDLSTRVDVFSGLPSVASSVLPAADAGAGAVAAWRREVAALDLDVAFALGDVDDASLEGLARYGVWRYCFGEELSREERTAGVREVTHAAAVTASGVIAKPGSGASDRLLYQSRARTKAYSIARNRDNIQRKSIAFAARAIEELHRCGPDWLKRCPPAECARGTHANRRTSAPAGTELVGGAARVAARIARRGLQKLCSVDQWFLGYRFGGGDRWTGDLRGYTRLMPPRDRYWADPFPFERDGRHYIFFEEFMFATGKAHIAVVEVRRDGTTSTPVSVLDRPYHLSYPLLLEEEGELYMVPESGANRTVEIYRCTRFPDAWRLEKVLLRGARFVDATLHRQDGRWWMFVNAGADGTELHDELHLYHADSLLGEWTPHERNPVKSDVRSARPAGRLYERDGVLYRPAQICAPLYGSGISVNRVVELSPQAYVEREEQRVLPTHPAGLLGLHTVNRAGDLTVVDGFMRRPRWRVAAPREAEPERLVPIHGTITEHGDN